MRRLQCLIDGGVRLDANETLFLEQELTFVEAESYDIEYSVLHAREFVPLDMSLPEWAEHWKYREYDETGMAAVIESYSDDLPRVDKVVKENVFDVLDIGDAYGYTIKELRANARMQTPIDRQRGIAARNAIERKQDYILAFGDALKNFKGLLNNPNVPDANLANGDWLDVGGGVAQTPDKILADMFAAEQLVDTQSGENHQPDTMLLPPAHYGHIATTPRSSTSDTTILQFFLANSQYVKTVRKWNRLTTADGTPGSGDPMGLCYARNPKVVKCPIAIDFEQLEPEKRNLEYVVNCVARMGGTTWYRPLAAVYMTGI